MSSLSDLSRGAFKVLRSPSHKSQVWKLQKEKPEGAVKWQTVLVTQFFRAVCAHGQVDVVFLLRATRDNAHHAEAVRRVLERLVVALGPLGPQAAQVWL